MVKTKKAQGTTSSCCFVKKSPERRPYGWTDNDQWTYVELLWRLNWRQPLSWRFAGIFSFKRKLSRFSKLWLCTSLIPFKRTTYLCSNESHPLASSQQVLFSLLLMDNNSWSHFYILTWKMHSGSSLGDTDKWAVSRMSPCGLASLFLAPWWARLTLCLTNRLASTLYYCVSKTHTCTQILSAHLIRQKRQTEETDRTGRE